MKTSGRSHMNPIDYITTHPLFIRTMKDIEQEEADRIYCRHGLSHGLDVARIAWIRVLTEHLSFSRDVVYAAGLLHDIGRLEEKKIGLSHDRAGVALAEQVLQDTPFLPEEKAMILNAVRYHRSADAGHDDFSLLICQADKASRNCFLCEAADTCYWDKSKRNMFIKD